MATATVKPVKPVKRTVLLELTEDEAVTLLFIAQHVGGTPGSKSRRGHVDSIGVALCDALDIEGAFSDRRVISGNIRFEDEPA